MFCKRVNGKSQHKNVLSSRGYWIPATVTILLGMTTVLPATGSVNDPARSESKTVRADFYISPDGDDSWSGKLAETNAEQADGPFATLERAREAVRKLRATMNHHGPIHVQLRGGTYRLEKPFVLRPEDSGSEASPVIYESFPGEKAVISGGKIISGWQKADGPLWKVEMPEVQAGKWYFRQMFVNGKRRHRPRYPKEDFLKLANLSEFDKNSWMAQSTPDEGELAKRAFQYEPGDIRSDWSNINDIEIVVLQFWTEARLRIQRLDDQKHVVLFTGGSFRPLTWSGGYYVDNVFEEISEPGSWYLDRGKGVLYYHPLPGEDLSQAEIIAPGAGVYQLLRLEGDVDQGRFVQHVRFVKLTFAYTAWELPEEGHCNPQAEITPPAAIFADGAYYCSLERCELSHLGAWGIEMRRGCRDNSIIGNTFGDLGAGCVKIGERENCDQDIEETRNIVVSDNRMLDAGQVYLGAAGIWIGQSSGNIISHNEITGPLMWAISVGWTWSYFPLQRARDNIIEFNHIHELGTGILGTHGAIYALGTSPGTVIRNNYIRNISASDLWGSGEGIILDNGCYGIVVENNVVYNAVAGGYGSNFNCAGNFIHNNIFLYGQKYQLTVYGDLPPGPKPYKGEIFAHNIIVWRQGPLLKESDWPDFSTLWDYNVYFHEKEEPVTFLSGKKYTFAQWQAKGMDEHSVVADPMFVDPSNGDFSLKPGSPALKLGFKPIDISKVGPRNLFAK
ncbi:MAG: right-handed parallel beta-helix repeat-containing protein [Sedimentisphaerales bacterium]|nr:right-handed parallel beta-helix repeat-containing protein [Sedimentisphaerales bacterium]